MDNQNILHIVGRREGSLGRAFKLLCVGDTETTQRNQLNQQESSEDTTVLRQMRRSLLGELPSPRGGSGQGLWGQIHPS